MSTEASLSRKEKKAQRDAERHKKSKKTKLADVDDLEPAIPEAVASADLQSTEFKQRLGHETVVAEESGESAAIAQKPTAESRSARRKRKSDDGSGTVEGKAAEIAQRSKKRKKNDETATKAEDDEAADEAGTTDRPTKLRFIVFIGNLPFKTTDASLQAHFKKLEPFTLRHRTDPKTKKSKGFAFLEFENYDRMKTCLKLYHHSMFDPEDKDNGGSGKGNGKGARKINVELTAGGGGKAAGRKEKIKVKNVRLEEQRKRRVETEKKEKDRKEKKEGSKPKVKDAGASNEPVQEVAEDTLGGMHPSRLARMGG